jgi:ribosomal protein L13
MSNACAASGAVSSRARCAVRCAGRLPVKRTSVSIPIVLGQRLFFLLPESSVSNSWYEIDAKNAVVGRLATVVSKIIRGKNKNTYTPHMDHGDFVVVKNIEQARFTGKKFQEKKYYRHTGHPGGIKETTPEKLHVLGMRLMRKMLLLED